MNTYPVQLTTHGKWFGWFWTVKRTPDDIFEWSGYALTKRGAKWAARRVAARDRRRMRVEMYELGGRS